MCWEDVKIGRETSYEQISKVVGTTATLLVPADPQRHSLMLGAPTTGRVTYSPLRTVTDGAGMVLILNATPICLNVKDDGAIVQSEWWAIGTAAGTQGNAIVSHSLR